MFTVWHLLCLLFITLSDNFRVSILMFILPFKNVNIFILFLGGSEGEKPCN